MTCIPEPSFSFQVISMIHDVKEPKLLALLSKVNTFDIVPRLAEITEICSNTPNLLLFLQQKLFGAAKTVFSTKKNTRSTRHKLHKAPYNLIKTAGDAKAHFSKVQALAKEVVRYCTLAPQT